MTTDQRRRELLAEKQSRIEQLERRLAHGLVILDGWRQESLAGKRTHASVDELASLHTAIGPKGGAR